MRVSAPAPSGHRCWVTTTPRATALIACCLLALTACSGSADEESSDARTTACRTYRLEVAGQDARAVKLLDRAARSGGWDNAEVNDALGAVRKAATDAGLVEDLPDDEFDHYGRLVEATLAAYVRANPDGGVGITGATRDLLGTAVDDVRSACDLG